MPLTGIYAAAAVVLVVAAYQLYKRRQIEMCIRDRSGLIFLIVPEIITFFITVLVCLANQFTCIQYLFAALLAQAVVDVYKRQCRRSRSSIWEKCFGTFRL